MATQNTQRKIDIKLVESRQVANVKIGGLVRSNGERVLVKPTGALKFVVGQPVAVGGAGDLDVVGRRWTQVSPSATPDALVKEFGGSALVRRQGDVIEAASPQVRRARTRADGSRTTVRVPPDLETAASHIAQRDGVSLSQALMALALLGVAVDQRQEQLVNRQAALDHALDRMDGRIQVDLPADYDPDRTAEELAALVASIDDEGDQ